MTILKRAAEAVSQKLGAMTMAQVEGQPAAWLTESGVVSDEHFREIARDVLRSIREPSPEMMRAGHIAVPGLQIEPHQTLAVYQAMIDAALRE